MHQGSFDVDTTVARIEKLAFGGNGVCRIDGKICFVPFSCPGDEVRLRITSQKKSYCTAEIVEIIKPSPDRDIPVCEIYGVCGGCSWQHVQYPVQLQQKRQIFANTLWRGGRVDGSLIGDTVASPLAYDYRSRVRFKVSADRAGLRIGFHRNSTHVVENALNGCPVAKPVINEILGCFRSILKDYAGVGFIDQISIDTGEQGAVAVVHYSGKDLSGLKSYLIGRSSGLGPCTGLFLQAHRKTEPEKLWGSAEISYCMPGRNPVQSPYVLTYLPAGFAQVNQIQNVALLTIIRRLGDFRPTDRLLDLYCGNGNFSILLADDVASVYGIEGSEGSIRSANSNKIRNNINNINFVCADARVALRRLDSDATPFDVILLDPPRTGAKDVVPEIARLNPSRIIYVSCDPSTLARDCGLLDVHGYRFVESVPLDMFPQTYHLESVTLLIKK